MINILEYVQVRQVQPSPLPMKHLHTDTKLAVLLVTFIFDSKYSIIIISAL